MPEELKTTKKIDKFSLFPGNRPIFPAHVNGIIKSIKEVGLLFHVIIVNELYQIIDGQHRFKAIQHLKEEENMDLTMIYVIKKGYRLPHIHAYNQNARNWGLETFMISYANEGMDEYKTYRFYKEKYKLGHNETMTILGTNKHYSTQITAKFKAGKFKCGNISEAVKIFEMIHDFEKYYEGFKRKAFALAITRLARKLPEYDHKRMLHKLSYQSGKLTDQTDSESYLKILEKIYNYKAQNNKVRFDVAM